ncbi:3-oxoadipate enol-lactonase [Derxia lacustris]|uniref:3-oxoadipate enol-lactonase n=1 Tax=Derxia lacustris TaxID=764842 RepID=UPI000A16FD29|nr:3-oxoadipate enol-lactonase [Derxia lacustris]
MPFIDHAGLRLHYRLDGPAGAPVVVFSNSLGTTLDMWDAQAAALAGQWRVLRYDTRGHGQSATAGGTSLADLGGDVVALLDALGIARASFVGISMGGITGQWLGVNARQRLDKLVVCNTAAKIGEASGWAARAALVREQGMAPVAASATGRWFTEGFVASGDAVIAKTIAQLAGTDAEGYAQCCEALALADLREHLDHIAVPTLVIAGSADPVTTVADAEFIAARVPGAQLVALPASHLSAIEAADDFNRALDAFLRA